MSNGNGDGSDHVDEETIKCIKALCFATHANGRGFNPHGTDGLILARVYQANQKSGGDDQRINLCSKEFSERIQEASGAKSARIATSYAGETLDISWRDFKLAGAVIQATLDAGVSMSLQTHYATQLDAGDTYSPAVVEQRDMHAIIDHMDMLNDDPRGTTSIERFIGLSEHRIYNAIRAFSVSCSIDFYATPCLWTSELGKRFARAVANAWSLVNIHEPLVPPCQMQHLCGLGVQLGVRVDAACSDLDCVRPLLDSNAQYSVEMDTPFPFGGWKITKTLPHRNSSPAKDPKPSSSCKSSEVSAHLVEPDDQTANVDTKSSKRQRLALPSSVTSDTPVTIDLTENQDAEFNDNEQSSLSIVTITPADCIDTVSDEAPPEQCTVCMDAPADTLVLPCGHNVACAECSRRLEGNEYNSRHCILCAEPIEQILYNNGPIVAIE